MLETAHRSAAVAGGAPAAAARVRAPQQHGGGNVNTRAQRCAALTTAVAAEPVAAIPAVLPCCGVSLQGRGAAHSQSVVRSLRFTPVAAKQREPDELSMLGQVLPGLTRVNVSQRWRRCLPTVVRLVVTDWCGRGRVLALNGVACCSVRDYSE